VKLASDLQAAELLFWAEASMAAGCEVYLRLPGHAYLPHKQKPLHWLFKCVMDRLVVFVVLLLLSPVLLGISLWIRIVFQESILVHQWHVGLRGRLYRACYFRTQSETDEGVAFTRWMRRYRLDRLPKFLNVLRGEMSIVGAFPQRLIDIPKVDPALHRQLNALPGITGAWQLESRLSRLDWRCLHNLNLEYLLRWSLRRDFSYLVLTAPKILIEENL
jgi:lipopolysaccharide/colanic/teichoic acid biosynthesis glycosyltransferase